MKPLAALTAALASVALTACGDDDDGAGGDRAQGGSITIAQTSQPDALDPALAFTVNSWEPLWLVYTPPVTYRRAEGESGTELIPGVAQELPVVSDDGRTYTFTIREGLEYSDGTPVRASDFEHTIKRVLNLEAGTFYFEGIEGASEYLEAGEADGDVSGIETSDKTGEVTIRLTEPNGQFLNVLAMNFAGMVPGDTPFRNLTTDPPPGVGPYVITESVPNRDFVMQRNENFDIPGIESGNIDTITTRIVKSAERQTQDVIRGELDYMQDPPPADLLQEVRAKYSDRYEEHPTVSTDFFFMNTRLPPFDDERVREAVNHALDETALARLLGGRLQPSCNFLPPDLLGFEAIDPCPFGDPAGGEPDIERARELIREARAEGAAVTAWTNTDESRPEIGQYLTDVLNEIGLDAELETVDGSVYFQTIGNERTGAEIGFVSFSQDYPHPGSFFALMHSESIAPRFNMNLGNVSDPELDALIDTVNDGPADDPDVQDAAAEADRLLIEKSYVAPYGTAEASTFMSERMDFENCSLFHPVYQNDYSSFCLKE